MTRRAVPGARAFAALLLAALAACFTEVGNPDEETPAMSARARVDDTAAAGPDGPDSVRITGFRLRLVDAAYLGADSAERPLWAARAGGSLDFAGGDNLALQVLESEPRKVVVRLKTDTASRFIRGTYAFDDSVRAFRLELPDTLRMTLTYDSASLASWNANAVYTCVFSFKAGPWLSVAGLDTARTYVDGTEGPFVLFDATRNPGLRNALLYRFVRSFNGSADYAGKTGTPASEH